MRELKVGDYYAWNTNYRDIYKIDNIDSIKAVLIRMKDNKSYFTGKDMNKYAKYIGNNEKIIRILYDDLHCSEFMGQQRYLEPK